MNVVSWYLYHVCATDSGMAAVRIRGNHIVRAVSHVFAPGLVFDLTNFDAMFAQENLPSIYLKFRVLIIGRANAGKTTILKRVCDTTESPEIYRPGPLGRRKQVRSCS